MSYRDRSGARPSRHLKDAPSFSLGAWLEAAASVGLENLKDEPKEITLPFTGAVVDQDAIPCCVAVALTSAMQFVGSTVALSPLFNFYLSRRDPAVIDDVEIFDAFRAAAVEGVCVRSLHPSGFDVASALAVPSVAARSDAVTRRLTLTPLGLPSFGHVNVSVVEWRTLIAKSLPVLFGFFMSPEYDAILNGNTVEHLAPTARGNGHAVIVVGYNDSAAHFIIRDSRGAGIGIGGTWHLPYARLSEAFIFEAWVVAAIP